MIILSGRKAENCLDGDFVFDYKLDSVWTKDLIKHLTVLGRLKYYETFPRPMFQLTCAGGTIIKGVQGSDECKIIFPRSSQPGDRKSFEETFEKIFLNGGDANGTKTARNLRIR